MNKCIKRLFLLMIYILSILCLFSCSVKEIFVEDVVAETTSAYIMTNMYDYAPMARSSAKVANLTMEMANEEADIVSNERKIITNYDISGETKTFDNTYDAMISEIKKLNGIIDRQSIDNQKLMNDQKQRFLYITVRIPSDNEEKFYKFLNDNIFILNKSESKQDITDNYNDTKIRIETLKEEEKRLKELFDKAKTVDELVKVENRMQEVRYEIQSLETKIKNLDNKIDFSTFNINLTEVVLFTEASDKVPNQDDLIYRFKVNLEKCKLFIIGIGIYIFTHLPAISLCLLTLLIVLFIIHIIIKKMSNKKNTVNKVEKVEKGNAINKEKIIIDKQISNTKNKDINVNKVILQATEEKNINNNNKPVIPKTTHYGDIAVRVMSDAEIEHDKKIKEYEDEKYNADKSNTELKSIDEIVNSQMNTKPTTLSDIKNMLDKKMDEQ